MLAYGRIILLACSALLLLPNTGKAQEKQAAMPQITVVVTDQTDSKELDVHHAMDYAANAFEHLGIHIHWVHCPLLTGEADPACKESQRTNAVEMRIVPEPGKGDKTIPPGALAYLHPHMTKNWRGGYATLFRKTLKDLVTTTNLPQSTVIGHVMVHAIGGLLLPEELLPAGEKGHLIQITDEDWSKAPRSSTHFTKRQEAAILDAVKKLPQPA